MSKKEKKDGVLPGGPRDGVRLEQRGKAEKGFVETMKASQWV